MYIQIYITLFIIRMHVKDVCCVGTARRMGRAGEMLRGRGFAGHPGALCMQGEHGGVGGGSTSPNLVNALIVFGALEDKNGISQSLWHGTEAAR